MKPNEIRRAIAGLDDDAVEQFLFDCLERRFGRAKLQQSDYKFNLTLPSGYRVLTPTVWIEAEVSNGGIGQYFWNRLIDYKLMTADAVEGYEKIGALAQAEAVRDCLRVFAPLESKCRGIKQQNRGTDGFLEWQDIWDGLEYRGDDPLFEYKEVTKLYRVPWIRRNIEAFRFPE
jgi:hypothetical protein